MTQGHLAKGGFLAPPARGSPARNQAQRARRPSIRPSAGPPVARLAGKIGRRSANPAARAFARQKPIVVSAMTGLGVETVLDAVLDALGVADAQVPVSGDESWSPL